LKIPLVWRIVKGRQQPKVLSCYAAFYPLFYWF
jgi:hypothetical protein